MENVQIVKMSSIPELSQFKHYEVHYNRGIFSIRADAFLTPRVNTAGYLVVNLSHNGLKKTVRLHRVMALAFIPNPENLPEVNHLYGVKTDFTVENLEWETGRGNMKHAYNTGLLNKKSSSVIGKRGVNSAAGVLSDDDLLTIVRNGKRNLPIKEIASLVGAGEDVVRKLLAGKRYVEDIKRLKLTSDLLQARKHYEQKKESEVILREIMQLILTTSLTDSEIGIRVNRGRKLVNNIRKNGYYKSLFDQVKNETISSQASY